MTKTVLVTGATGFLACYVIDAYLKAGYKVRGTVRSKSKADYIRKHFNDQIELVQVSDLVTGEGLDQAMKGCDVVAHVASPYILEYKDPLKDLIDPAVKGTLSVLKAANDAGIKRVVVTSSFAAITDFSKGGPFRDYTYTSDDWNPTTLEQACEPGKPGPFVYSASKKLADKAAHEFAKEHNMVVCTIVSRYNCIGSSCQGLTCRQNPPMIYGPPIQGVDQKGHINTSSNAIYALINGPGGRDIPWNRLPLFCNVKDVATAHVRASEADDTKVAGQRFILCASEPFLWEDVCFYQ